TNPVDPPWYNGVYLNKMEKYSIDTKFKNWVLALFKAQMLKAQTPVYEPWMWGVQGKNVVTCIYCHMPTVPGAACKVSTYHKIGNPFDAFERTCANCHEQSKEKLQAIVKSRKHDIKEVITQLEAQVVKTNFEKKTTWDAGATEEKLKDALKSIRRAQWGWEYSAAGHGGHV
ncbi:ammonia-forming cytochrome c nitrite reductase subunit c552, partial [[Pasteurella] aerogenes]